jgi:hypothetical protein
MVFGPTGPNTSTSQEAAQNLMAPLGGIPYVPTAYAYTTSAGGVALTSADHWLAYPVLPDVDYASASLSIYKTAVVDADAVATIALYSDNGGVPGTLLETLGTVTVGAGAGWFRKAFAAAYQKQRGVRLWTVIKGQAAKSFTIGVNRWRGAILSMFPDNVLTPVGNCAMSTTNAGANWTAVTVDSKPAMVLTVENSTANHTPVLMWCKKWGAYDYLLDGIYTIPDAGITLSCESLTPDTLYYLYRYGNSIETSVVAPVISNGVEVRGDALTHRFVGVIQPTTVGSQVAPVNTMRYVGVSYKGLTRSFGAPNPYAGASAVTETLSLAANANWDKWMANDDWTIKLLPMPGSSMTLTVSVRAGQSGAYAVHCTIGINAVPSGATNPQPDNAFTQPYGDCSTHTFTRTGLDARLITIYQCRRALAAGSLNLWEPAKSDCAFILGELRC